MGSLQIIIRNRLFYSLAATILLLSFALNIFGLGLTNSWFNNFERYSEELPLSSVNCSNEGNYSGGLAAAYGENKCDVYPSQFGMQGYILSSVTSFSDGLVPQGVILSLARIFLVVALILVLLLFVGFAHKQYGQRVAALLVVFFSLSPWLAGFSDKLYWVIFLFLLPFIFILYFYPGADKNKSSLVKMYIVLYVLFLLKFLNGYEYISVVALSAATPVIYWELLKAKINLKLIAKRVALIGIVSVVAFCSALAIHIVSLTDSYGTLSSAASVVQDRGLNRSFDDPQKVFPVALYNFIDMQPELYQLIDNRKDIDVLYNGEGSAYSYISLMILSYLFMPVINLPVQSGGLLTVMLESFFAWLVLAVLLLKFDSSILKGKLSRHRRALAGALALSLIAAVSWFVLGFGHVLVHAHINGILLYMPLMLWIYLTAAIGISSYSRKICQKL